jgi:tetratricopeptide (TPR) repeat protein
LKLGEVDKASKRFRRALEMVQHHVGALNGMAAVLIHRSDYNELLNVYNNIIHYEKDSSEVLTAYLRKGRALHRYFSRPKKAFEHYERCLTIEPKHPEALAAIGHMAAVLENYDAALEYVDTLDASVGVAAGLHVVAVLVRGACMIASNDSSSAFALLPTLGEEQALTDRLTGADDANVWLLEAENLLFGQD